MLARDRGLKLGGRQIAETHVRALFVEMMPPPLDAHLGFDAIPVREHDGIFLLVGDDGGLVDSHHIGTILKVSKAAKALGFALREESVVRDIEALERGIALRVYLRLDFQAEFGLEIQL